MTQRFEQLRSDMVAEQLIARGIKRVSVLRAMSRVPREMFIPTKLADQAYNDNPLPIGLNQTISQPYIVALMTESLQLTPECKVLEIGTGSGYQTAVLAEISEQVYSMEVKIQLLDQAKKVLRKLKYKNIKFLHSSGRRGWPEAAPFDRIIVTAGGSEIPAVLIKQLNIGGILVMPVGETSYQNLIVLTKIAEDNLQQEKIIPVTFVPLV